MLMITQNSSRWNPPPRHFLLEKTLTGLEIYLEIHDFSWQQKEHEKLYSDLLRELDFDSSIWVSSVRQHKGSGSSAPPPPLSTHTHISVYYTVPLPPYLGGRGCCDADRGLSTCVTLCRAPPPPPPPHPTFLCTTRYPPTASLAAGMGVGWGGGGCDTAMEPTCVSLETDTTVLRPVTELHSLA